MYLSSQCHPLSQPLDWYALEEQDGKVMRARFEGVIVGFPPSFRHQVVPESLGYLSP